MTALYDGKWLLEPLSPAGPGHGGFLRCRLCFPAAGYDRPPGQAARPQPRQGRQAPCYYTPDVHDQHCLQ